MIHFGNFSPHPAFGHLLPQGEGSFFPSPAGRGAGVREKRHLEYKIMNKVPGREGF
jgi:hypothetical protein